MIPIYICMVFAFAYYRQSLASIFENSWSQNISCSLSKSDVFVETTHTIFVGRRHSLQLNDSDDQAFENKACNINTFLGIPYAVAPTGDLRFQQAKSFRYGKTKQLYCAKEFKPSCMQYAPVSHRFLPDLHDVNEDCLFLNIFYPHGIPLHGQENFPVLAHIHGGSFVSGSSCFYPGYALACTGLVVVTLNYRLGPFGFLSVGKDMAGGNMGIGDQRLALQWIQENIHWFHGDPARVTLMGESAGAASVDIHLSDEVSNSRGLFHRAIMISGSRWSPWANTQRRQGVAIENAHKLSRRLNFSRFNMPQNVTELLNFLKSAPAEELATAADQMNDTVEIWTPTGLGRTKVKSRSSIPLLIGVMENEASMKAAYIQWKWNSFDVMGSEHVTNNILRGALCQLLRAYKVKKNENVIEKLLQVYDNGSAMPTRADLFSLYSDFFINVPTYHSALEHLLANQNVFFFIFGYSRLNEATQNMFGTYHGAEIPFLFGYHFLEEKLLADLYPNSNSTERKKIPSSRADKEMSSTLFRLWHNFVKHGNPTPEPINGFLWPKLSSIRRPYVYLGRQQTVLYDFRAVAMAAWAGFSEEYKAIAIATAAVGTTVAPLDSRFQFSDRNAEGTDATIQFQMIVGLSVGLLTTLAIVIAFLFLLLLRMRRKRPASWNERIVQVISSIQVENRRMV